MLNFLLAYFIHIYFLIALIIVLLARRNPPDSASWNMRRFGKEGRKSRETYYALVWRFAALWLPILTWHLVRLIIITPNKNA